ncbi:hypothetical protein Cgig2_017859 [Carnegiea gigantea]|uniref:Uncharacterized protein n=1 Tax=Carnegiea gigantea TaxID=171969 RepID=A0A9Q1QQF6_9CARY|nr:hypothetical protein Cgig2_017859 [Carnegiea gigantea]
MATIAAGYAEGAQQVLTTEQGARVTVLTIVFGGREAPRFASPHNGPLVVEMKVVSTIVRRILINTGSSVDIITWDCLKKLTYPGWDIVPLVYPILGFRGQEVNLTGMIHLPLRFGDKLKARNLEADFLVINISIAYNIILGRPTIHKRVGCFTFQTIPLTGRWNKLHFFGVPALDLGPLALIYIVEIGFEVVILVEVLSQCHQDLAFSQRRWCQAMSPSSFRHSAVAFTPQAKASAMVTSSSVTLRGSEEPEAAKS